MKSLEKFEDRLRIALYAETDKIASSEDMFLQISRKIKSRKMGVNNMNIKATKRTRGMLIACLILVLTTATCFAAVKITSYTGHGTNSTFTTFPTENQVKNKAGFVPKYVSELPGGYVFEKGGIGEVTANGEDGSKVKTVKSVSLYYKNEDSSISLYVENGILPESEEGKEAGKAVKITSAVEGTYYSDMYKFVPADYTMTEQDKADEASGKYIFTTYGSDKVEINPMQQLAWSEDGMCYRLLSSDGMVDETILVKMAAEIVHK
ncbi:hypothetical protein [Aminipila luticellarii]|uniref:Signal peptide protein n=1 Tax=Aminipila luticellarii TaxID=2507160 RepID=A0A410PVU1_9FIRM|nr:hypothetical protein [Aminipila luticellarii]QAT43045.1 signal peptide protein [Aminipila luticellarii]